MDGSAHCAWNPLPLARWTPIALPKPSGAAPWGLVDRDGRRYPVQVIEGATGSQLLTVIELGALESAELKACNEPVPGAHWE